MATTSIYVVVFFSIYIMVRVSYSTCVVSNCTTHCVAELQNCINNCTDNYCGIEIASGLYEWYVNSEPEGQSIIINNKQNIEIYGVSNSTGHAPYIIVHGIHGIFKAYKCVNITIRNLVIDFHRYPYSYGQVININKSSNTFTLQIDPTLYPYPPSPYLNDGQNYSFLFTVNSILGYDSVNNHPIFPDIYSYATIKINSNMNELTINGINDHNINDIQTNSHLIIRHNFDLNYFAFECRKCTNFVMEDITMYTHTGPCIHAYQSHNVRISRVQLIKNVNRPLSIYKGAAYFPLNTGNIIIENSTFEGQGDDGLNILNFFYQIDKVISPNSLQIERHGAQTNNVGAITIGDEFQFRNRKTMQPYFSSKVANIIYKNNMNIISFKDNIPMELLNIYDVITDNTSLPTSVIIRNNLYSSNRARGNLLKVSNVTFLNNTYENITGPAILIRPESAQWLESTASHNVYIKNNHIKNCNYGPANENGTIMITATICGWNSNGTPNTNELPLNIGQVHKNITIKNNILDQILDNNEYINHSAISIRAVYDFTISNNTFIIPTQNYTTLQKFNDDGIQSFIQNKCVITSSEKSTSCKVAAS
eukprot:247965_1